MVQASNMKVNDRIKEAYLNRDKPVVVLELEGFSSSKSSVNRFEYCFYFSDRENRPLNSFEQDYRTLYPQVRTVGIEKLKQQKFHQDCQTACYESKLKDWITRNEVIENSTKGCLWVLKDTQPTCISGSEAEKDDQYIIPRFITNPDRFNKELINPTSIINYCTKHNFRKINDSLAEHISYKTTQIWSIADISTFLLTFFKIPKKFEDITKSLPEKNLKEVIQLFYILKYQFKLKKCLRIQARRKREEVAKEHAKKIISVLRKKFPDQEYLSQMDLLSLVGKNKFTSKEVYYEKYGKDTSKIQHAMRDFLDYSRYKECAFGGEKLTDEGTFNGEDTSRKGTSQWTYEEKMMFIKLFKQYGRNWNEIANIIGSKSPSQVRNFFQNYKKKLKLDSISNEQDEITILAAAGITNKVVK
jgi:Myb-like DNA-binding domain